MLRAVGPTGDVYEDAVARFTEDGLRVMRAVRFAAALEFALDPETERGIGPALPSLAKVSKERISDELRKLLAANQPSRGLKIAERSGIIALIAPELAAGLVAWRTVEPDPIARWLARVDAVSVDVRLGALFAELTPPDAITKRLDRAAVQHATTVLKRLKFSNEEATRAGTLVGLASMRLCSAWTEPEARRVLADVTRTHAQAAVELVTADGATELAGFARAILARGDALAVGDLAVGGKDLISALAIPAGPSVGRILAALIDRALADPAINTREQLIELARGLELELAR